MSLFSLLVCKVFVYFCLREFDVCCICVVVQLPLCCFCLFMSLLGARFMFRVLGLSVFVCVLSLCVWFSIVVLGDV